MGFWGDGFFESDRDLDIVYELDSELGISALQDQAIANAKQEKARDAKSTNASSTGDKDDADEDDDVHLTVYGAHCSDPDLVRKHLESSDTLKNKLRYFADPTQEDKTMGMESFMSAMFQPAPFMLNTAPPATDSNKYYHGLVLGVCAMSLGCNIPGLDLKGIMKNMLKRGRGGGLFPEQKSHLKTALHDKWGYVPGKPWEYRGKSVVESAHAKHVAENPFGEDVCGMCGRDKGMGEWEYDEKTGKFEEIKAEPSLMVCGGCKTQKYCSSECQKMHWKIHKPVCKKV